MERRLPGGEGTRVSNDREQKEEEEGSTGTNGAPEVTSHWMMISIPAA